MNVINFKEYLLFILFILLVFTVLFIIYMSSDGNIMYYYIENSDLDIEFKDITSKILSNTKWKNIHSIKEVKNNIDADIIIKLATDEELDKWHNDKLDDKLDDKYDDGTPIRFSITWQGSKSKPRVYINYKNWQGVPYSGLTVDNYRKYVIEHEFGHALGYNHLECNENTVVNGRCPVMYQSTRGCNNYKCGFIPSIKDFNAPILPFAYRLNK